MLDLTTKSGQRLVGDLAHFGWGGFVFMILRCHFDLSILTSILCVVGFTSGKEYWWDIRYETPESSGGYKGSARDQLGWLVGVAAAIGISYIPASLFH